MTRSTLLAATMLAALAVSHAHAASPYRGLSVPIYTCTAKSDNSVALNGLLAAGGDVEVAAGKCHLASGLIVSVPGTTLNGAGAGQTIFEPLTLGADIDIITVGQSGPAWSGGGFTLSNFTTDGRLTTTANPNALASHGIHITGGVHATTGFPFGAALINVETEDYIGGVWITGSDVTATGLNTHNNRHSGFFVQGSLRYPAPYNSADSDGMLGSTAANNQLDNTVGLTWDNVNFSNDTSNGFVGGPNVGDGNTISGGDVLFGCPPTESKCAGVQVGPFLAQGNVVTSTQPIMDIGIRAYGNVTGVTISNNTVNAGGTGIELKGDVTNSTVSTNIISGPSAFGIELNTLAGGAAGDNNIVQSNDITMASNKPCVSVIAQTNVQVLDNNGHGAPYATSQAGAGLVFTGNQ